MYHLELAFDLMLLFAWDSLSMVSRRSSSVLPITRSKITSFFVRAHPGAKGRIVGLV